MGKKAVRAIETRDKGGRRQRKEVLLGHMQYSIRIRLGLQRVHGGQTVT